MNKTFKTILALAIGAVAMTFASCSDADSINEEQAWDGKVGALIDLHCHLDGAVDFATARELAKMNGMPELSDDKLYELTVAGPECHDLLYFLTKFAYVDELLQTKEAITYAVNRLVHRLHDDGAIYAEIRFAPCFHLGKGLTQEEVVEAAIAGLDDDVMPARIILCLVRLDHDVYDAMNQKTAEVAVKYHGKGVVALDLACDDGTYAIKPYASYLNYAREHGVPLSVHAGETAVSGAWSVRDIMELGASRIDHGIQAYKDKALMAEIAQRGLVMTVCPSSYVCTGIFPTHADVPVRQLMQASCKVCINTDDMSTIGTTLSKEYQLARDTYGLSKEEIAMLLHNAADGAFVDASLRAKLHKQIDDFY